MSSYLSNALQDIEDSIERGDYEKARKKLQNIESSEELEENDVYQISVLKCNLYNNLGDFNKTIELVDKIIPELEDKQLSFLILEFYALKINALRNIGKFQEELELIEKGETIIISLQKTPTKELFLHKAKFLNLRGTTNWATGKFDKALAYFQKSLSISEDIDEKRAIAITSNNIGIIYSYSGEFDSALEFLEQSLSIGKELGNLQVISRALLNIGAVYSKKGELNQALDYYEECLDIREKIGNKNDISLVLNNIGTMYYRKGELELGLEYLTRSLKLKEEIGNTRIIANTLGNIGLIFRQKGELKRSLSIFERALSLKEQIGNPREIANSLLDLVETHIDMANIDEAKKYLSYLKKINSKERSKIIDHQTKICEALVLTGTRNSRDRIKAEDLLREITNDEIIVHHITIKAILLLSNILVAELKLSGEYKILVELKQFLKKLLEIATIQFSYSLLAETLLLQSQVALIEFGIEESRRLLNQAQMLAEEKGLKKLAKNISDNHDRLLSKLELWEEYKKNEVSIEERLQLLDIEDLVENIMWKKSIVPAIDKEEPLFLVALTDGGLPLFNYKFTDETNLDEFLISGFIEAISVFSREMFASEGNIERIKHQDFTLIARYKKPLLFCYMFRGHSYSAQQKLHRFLTKTIKYSKLWETLPEKTKTGTPITIDMEINSYLSQLSEEIFETQIKSISL